jgi:tripartite-type tricarboxylate transporter receptor subunit TctC
LQDLIKAAKAAPGRITYASVGLGSLPHLAAEMFAQQAGIQLLHVPYKGAAPAMQDLLSGVVDLTFESALTNTVTHFAQGKLKVLATTGTQRVPILSQVPSANEVLPGFTAQGWFGFFGPAGLPAPITAKLNEVAVAMLREPALLERFEKLGIQADPSAPAQFARYLQEQDRLWAGATKGLNLQLD